MNKDLEKRTDDLMKANELLNKEIEARKEIEAALKSREMELEEKKRDLEDMNAALRVLLKQNKQDRAELETNILANVKSVIFPFIEKLKSRNLGREEKEILSEIELLLKNITSNFSRDLSSEYIGLSSKEIQIASLIKEGKSSKEIALLLNISMYTVMSYRFLIRKKTGLIGKKVNLSRYLQNLINNNHKL
jgi:DNA-binding NarL/FixJ family response regulator